MSLITIPKSAKCFIKNWAFGLDLSVVATLFIRNGGPPQIYPITELFSEVPDDGLLSEEFYVQFLSPQINGEAVMAEICSGEYRGTFIYLKIKGEAVECQN